MVMAAGDPELLISVIVPCHNYAHYLDETLRSIEAQTVENWECLLVDDGSTDDTPALARAWCERDARFRYLRQAQSGVNAARNRGIAKSRGAFLQFLDADDLLAATKFEKQLALFERHPRADVVIGDFVFMNNENSACWQWSNVRSRIKDDAPRDVLASWEKGLMIAIHSYLVRRSCFERWGMWDETLPTHEDWEIQLRFAAGGAQYVHHADIVAAYRKHHDSLAGNATKMRQGFLMAMLKILASEDFPARLKPLAAFRYLEEVFATFFFRFVKKRRLDLKQALGNAGAGKNQHRVFLNTAALLLLPVLGLLRVHNSLRARLIARTGKNRRLDYGPWPLQND